jgi:hypothetical protein
MRYKEVISEQDKIVSTGGDKLLYHSTTYAHAAAILSDDGFKPGVSDGGNPVKKDSFISFSRVPYNTYAGSNMSVTFEIDEEKLQRHLNSQARKFGFDPYRFARFYHGERETRLNLGGTDKITNLKKFVRAIHVWPVKDIQDVASWDLEADQMPAMVGGLDSDPNRVDPADPNARTPQGEAQYRKIVRGHAKTEAQPLDEMLKLAKQKGIRTHVYLDRADFLTKRLDRSARVTNRPAIFPIVKALLQRKFVKAARLMGGDK